MTELTDRQQEVLDFIQQQELAGRPCPSHREIARHFRFRSSRAAACHLEALARKGFLARAPGKARSLRVASPFRGAPRRPLAHVPVFGAIPAGFADTRQQEAKGCITVDVETIGIKPTARTFALEVRGDSMIGKHIVDGDFVIVEHGMTPRPGDVVTALIDGESTLKTFMLQRGKPFLRAENPRYPDLIPAQELVIQGVVAAVIRKLK
jgi:repressor LexA